MSLAWKRLRVYVRGSLVFVLTLAVGLVLWNNRANRVSFWFFGLTDEAKQINVVWLILTTVGTTRILWWLFSFGHGLWRDFHELRRVRVFAQAAEQQARRAAELTQRERRIEDKMRQADAGANGLKE